jgi:hypothetical protein
MTGYTADHRGLYDKYEVYRTDGKGVGPCVVLEFDDPNTWPALLTWAGTAETTGNAQLARDVRDKVAAHQHLAALHHARREGT